MPHSFGKHDVVEHEDQGLIRPKSGTRVGGKGRVAGVGHSNDHHARTTVILALIFRWCMTLETRNNPSEYENVTLSEDHRRMSRLPPDHSSPLREGCFQVHVTDRSGLRCVHKASGLKEGRRNYPQTKLCSKQSADELAMQRNTHFGHEAGGSQKSHSNGVCHVAPNDHARKHPGGPRLGPHESRPHPHRQCMGFVR